MTIDQDPGPKDRLHPPVAGGSPVAETFDPFAPPVDGPRAVDPGPSLGIATAAPGGFPPGPRRRGRASSGLVLVAAMLLAVAGVAFAVGRTSAPASTAGGAGSFGNGAAGPRASGDIGQAGAGGSISLTGTVVEVTSDHLTLKLASGQTVQVALDSSTAYHAQTAASGTDLAQGASVTVRVAGGGPTASGGPSAAPSGAAAASAAPSGAAAASGGTPRSLTAEDVTITGN